MVIRGLRWFFRVAALLALIAGVLLFVLASETDRFFSWTIEPPATAAFLGAAYWAACVLLAWAAAQRSWPRVRPAIPPVFVIAVLLLVATLIRLDKFDLDSIFGWFWLVVYVTVPPLLALLVLRQHRAAGPVHPGAGGIALGARALLIAQATVMLALGGALFVAPTSADALWPWTLTPLTAEAIGAFLVGFGIAAAAALWEDDLDRLEGAALAYTTLGVLELAAVAIHSDDLTSSGLGTALYVALWVSVVAAGAYGLIARRAASRS
ncbi:MAG TPA: hypothetical protein VK920_10965 [Solirubrobacterales bacterium]|nr:hypothetical protein [Solirubrobacterales bacterium]